MTRHAHPLTLTLALALAGLLAAGCTEEPKDAREVVTNLEQHLGRRVVMTAKFRPGIRCRLDTEDGEWATYCRDCQVCKGPYVVDIEGDDVDAWPMVLAGTWNLRDIRCKGPLNEIECYPFEVGKRYVVEGVIERSTPPRLFVDGFREAE